MDTAGDVPVELRIFLYFYFPCLKYRLFSTPSSKAGGWRWVGLSVKQVEILVFVLLDDRPNFGQFPSRCRMPGESPEEKKKVKRFNLKKGNRTVLVGE